MQRPVVVPRSLLPSVTPPRTMMGFIGSDPRLLIVTWSKLPAERPVSRLSRPVVLLSLVRAPAQPPQHAYFGSQSHTPSSRCLRFERRVAATPARLAPVLLARLWTDQTCTGKLASASPIAPRIRLSDWLHPKAHGGGPRCTRRRRSTPSAPKNLSSEKRLVPRPCTLCRLRRNARARSSTWLSTAR